MVCPETVNDNSLRRPPAGTKAAAGGLFDVDVGFIIRPRGSRGHRAESPPAAPPNEA